MQRAFLLRHPSQLRAETNTTGRDTAGNHNGTARRETAAIDNAAPAKSARQSTASVADCFVAISPNALCNCSKRC